MRHDRPDLAERVEHVAHTRGDGAGFDVLSFDVGGEERYIEVKTTRRGATFPFYVSRNEVQFSKDVPHEFRLYRLHSFDETRPGMYVLPGALDVTCALDPVQYSARPRAS